MTMTPARRAKSGRQDWEALALRALEAGDLPGARAALTEAIRLDRRNGRLHGNLGAVLASLGEVEDAAIRLTEALRLEPRQEDVARRLSRLLARYVISEPGRLDALGLKAAFAHATIDTQPIADVAIAHLAAAHPLFSEALAAARAGEALVVARRLVLSRTADWLDSDLFLAALTTGVIIDPDVERLLTAIRRILLLEVPPDRFQDRTLTALWLALVAQGWNNDHAWAESNPERAALAQLSFDRAALLSGDLEAARTFMLLALYRPLPDLLPTDDGQSVQGMRPKPLRELIAAELHRLHAVTQAASALPRLATAVDETSRRVGLQYERSPYPRWRSLHVSAPGTLRTTLSRYFSVERLNFMDDPFDVLVAGAGTGKQALQAAFAYGPHARLLATDLSSTSLGYAAAAAQRYKVSNVDFLLADILDLDGLDRMFDVIECVGVLHHMSDPWLGWRKLLSRLKPDGLMYIGLYSAISRENLRRLRDEAGYPGPGCDDAVARAYRAELMARADGCPGAELKTSRDFYSLNEFRDLVLHPCEHHVTLADVSRFLDENGLEFRGFVLDTPQFDAFAAANPDASWPGTFDAWHAFELANPRTFDGMYRFWCARVRQD